MTPTMFAVSAFIAMASGIISFAVNKYNQDRQTKKDDELLDLQKKNLALNENTAQQNFDLSKEQFEYQKQLNDLTMQREDTAFQRQVADLQAAGLSPLMVAGNGASATPLTTSTAPHMDLSGINQALSNMVGSYNDVFNRKLQRQQFALQSKVQKAQTYTQLAELYMNQKKANLENKYLSEKLKWEKTYGFRDYDWKSIITGAIDKLVRNYSENTTIPNLGSANFNTAGFSLPDGKTLFESILPEKETYTPPTPTPKQIEKDKKEIIKYENKDYSHALNILQTRSPTKYNLNDDDYMKAVKYFYYHTNAWRDYETQEAFINKFLADNKNRSKLREKYPLPAHRELK